MKLIFVNLGSNGHPLYLLEFIFPMIQAIIQLVLAFILLIPAHPAHAQREVSVQRFADIALSRTLQFPATVINLQLANVAAETSGRILSFPLEVGDEVSKGQLLLEINCTTARINENRVKAGLKRLKANRQLTRQQLERAQRLHKTSSISREELDQRQTQLDADNASIEEQQSLLQSATQAVNDCQLKAPFDGTVIEKMTSIGAYTQPGSPILKLLKRDAVEIQLEIPLNVLPHLKQATEIAFELNGENYPIKLRKILPRVNSANFQQLCRLTFSAQQKPAGGSLGLVRFDTRRNFIPPRYIQKRNGQFGVFILSDNRAIFKPLPGAQEGQSVAVELPDDTRIITSPLKILSAQEAVKIQP